MLDSWSGGEGSCFTDGQKGRGWSPLWCLCVHVPVMQCFSTFFEPRHTFYIQNIPRHTTNQKCYKMTQLHWQFSWSVEPGSHYSGAERDRDTQLYLLTTVFYRIFNESGCCTMLYFLHQSITIIQWNYIISYGTPDDLSRHTSVPRHTGWKTLSSVETNSESASSFIIGAYTATWHNTTYSKTIVIPRNICLCLPFLIHDRLACGNRYGYAPPHCPRPASLQPVGQWYAPQRGVYYQQLRSARGPRPSVQLQRGSLCWVEAIVVEELQLQAGRNALSSVGSETAPCAFASPLFQTSTTQSEKQSRVLCPVRVSV